MVKSSILGYPRMGPARELKKALEKYWASQGDERSLVNEAARVRALHWKDQAAAGIDFIPSGDFSLYDHVLDTAAMLGAFPERYGSTGEAVSLSTYFAMARGSQATGRDLPALEMTKWFDTNYHYIVPEVDARQRFHLSFTKAVDHFEEARALGVNTRPVLLGPVTFLSLAKPADGKTDPLSLLDGVLPVYEQILARLSGSGAGWVQMDEPILVTDLGEPVRKAFLRAYARLRNVAGLKIMLATYFGDLRENLDLVLESSPAGLHVDLVRGSAQGERLLSKKPKELVLSLGLVDGRNIWKADLEKAIGLGERFVESFGSERVIVASSCSLLHCPEDLSLETGLDPELLSWMAFARQKATELTVLARALNNGRQSVSAELEESRRAQKTRQDSPRTMNKKVRERLAGLTPAMARRKSAYAERRKTQAAFLKIPLYPTTTIGSFPQTQKVRSARAEFRKGALTTAQYEQFLDEEMERTIKLQEELGLDVLVHGEFERNDMVEYFGEMLSGFAFTRNGWVQSYGSRCVKPPLIYGDVDRPRPMTVRWSSRAQSLTKRLMKGMLTGPVTILQWSFVRDDQPREITCRQIALAIRDEVCDLEASGIKLVQIDEPALREGLPLRRSDWKAYLTWAVEAFRLASSGVKDETQIHTHMCYSEFNDIVPSIGAMDADVISVESARSRMELLGAFHDYRYPNEIGPGVYDIHSPRVPSADEITALLEKALEVLKPEQLWVNPDCGLKTRQWSEVKPALTAMVEAARRLRQKK
jgi:5-methyltetrahydropteroyltriglutamate--homocysteine methyltransferase